MKIRNPLGGIWLDGEWMTYTAVKALLAKFKSLSMPIYSDKFHIYQSIHENTQSRSRL
jgi:hypothetical protein